MAAAAMPCDGIDRSLTDQDKEALAPAFIQQLNQKRPETAMLPHVSQVDVIAAFRSEGWSIFYVGPEVSDEALLFYSGDPRKSKYLMLWAGYSPSDTEKTITDWEFEKMPGIPKKLAACFAWHLLKDTTGWSDS